MTIENGIVAAGDLGMQLQVLQALVGVFHTFSLTYVTDDACVVSLNLELQSANSEGIIRLKHILFVSFETAIHPAGLKAVDAHIFDQKRAEDRVVDKLKVILANTITCYCHILAVHCPH